MHTSLLHFEQKGIEKMQKIGKTLLILGLILTGTAAVGAAAVGISRAIKTAEKDAYRQSSENESTSSSDSSSSSSSSSSSDSSEPSGDEPVVEPAEPQLIDIFSKSPTCYKYDDDWEQVAGNGSISHTTMSTMKEFENDSDFSAKFEFEIEIANSYNLFSCQQISSTINSIVCRFEIKDEVNYQGLNVQGWYVDFLVKGLPVSSQELTFDFETGSQYVDGVLYEDNQSAVSIYHINGETPLSSMQNFNLSEFITLADAFSIIVESSGLIICSQNSFYLKDSNYIEHI